LKLNDYKAVFTVAGLTGVLLCAFPSLAMIFQMPTGETFSELWILGPDHMAEGYPFNVKSDEPYRVFLGVSNHMRVLSHYVAYVKFRNQREPLPNSTAATPSPLPPLYEYHVTLQDGESCEEPLTFSFSNVTWSENQCLVRALVVNGVIFTVDKSASWDADETGCYYQLFIELWIYDVGAEVLRFDNRFVSLRLNMTSSP